MLNEIMTNDSVLTNYDDEYYVIKLLVEECKKYNRPFKQYLRIYTHLENDYYMGEVVYNTFKSCLPIIKIDNAIFLINATEDHSGVYIDDVTNWVPTIPCIDIEI